MKASKSLVLFAVPLVLGGAAVFHPGVAFAATKLSKLAPTHFSEDGTYNVDPMHTSVGFEIGHLGLSKVQGRFDKVSGKIVANAENLDASSVDITIEANSVDTAVAPRDADLRSPNFLDVDKFSTITFKSHHIRRTNKGYVAVGDFTLKGVTKEIAIPFKKYGPIKDPWGNSRIGIVSSPIEINRQDYGVAYNVKLPSGAPAVANELLIRLSAEGTLAK